MFACRSRYKVRDYGNGANSATGAVERKTADEVPCAKGVPGCRPDGFGGYVKRDAPVKSIPKQIFSDDDAPAPPPRKMTAAAPPPAASTASSSKPLSIDDMISNSITQKESILGRELTAAEKADMANKVRALMK